jgi:NDP-sugar pyrophosphorylase family protein
LDIDTVIIPVGGKGSRMTKSLEERIQKCLIPVQGNPILYYVIEAFRRKGCRRIYLLANHLSEQIHDFVASDYKGIFSSVNVEIIDVNSRGTAEALFTVKNKIKSPFFYSNGDLAFKTGLIDMLLNDYMHDVIATMAFSRSHLASTHPYCTASTMNGGLFLSSLEFPTQDRPHSFEFCSMETMILSSEIFDFLPSVPNGMLMRAVDLAHRKGSKARVTLYEDEWMHLETDADLVAAEAADFLNTY